MGNVPAIFTHLHPAQRLKLTCMKGVVCGGGGCVGGWGGVGVGCVCVMGCGGEMGCVSLYLYNVELIDC